MIGSLLLKIFCLRLVQYFKDFHRFYLTDSYYLILKTWHFSRIY
jgi:hypothetical protein